jgi:sugar phosphate isomerase/epimerase
MSSVDVAGESGGVPYVATETTHGEGIARTDCDIAAGADPGGTRKEGVEPRGISGLRRCTLTEGRVDGPFPPIRENLKMRIFRGVVSEERESRSAEAGRCR